jgi:hypothetical protein
MNFNQGASMKKILFVMSVLTLMSYGCNRSEDAVKDTGMQREESINDGRIDDTQNMDSPAYEDSDVNVDPQREEFRGDDSSVSEPIDDRPRLDEEN